MYITIVGYQSIYETAESASIKTKSTKASGHKRGNESVQVIMVKILIKIDPKICVQLLDYLCRFFY